jgi:hypothetical protein
LVTADMETDPLTRSRVRQQGAFGRRMNGWRSRYGDGGNAISRASIVAARFLAAKAAATPHPNGGVNAGPLVHRLPVDLDRC